MALRLDPLLQDLRYGARALRRRPGFTVAAGLSLALGIGVTTAIFTVVNAVALRPLPYADPGRLVWISEILHGSSTDELTITPDFLDWRRLNRSFTALAAYNYSVRSLTGPAEPVEVRTARASANLLPLLGVAPEMGRYFRENEDQPGSDAVALLSHDFWRRQFAGDPRIPGRPILLDGRQFTVVGVLPEGFVFPGPDPVEVITPLAKNEPAERERGQNITVVTNVVGRLRPGVSERAAHAELTAIQARLPDFLPWHPKITIHLVPLRDHLFGDAAAAAGVLVTAAGFLLLIACANVSNLLLARLAHRDRELAVRRVLGGSRGRLIVQLLTESALLGMLACAAGLLLAWWLRRPLAAFSPYRASAWRNLPFDGRVLAFAILCGMLTTLLFGILPAFRATEIRLAGAMQAGAPGVAGGRGALRMLSLIASAEIAVTLVLATGAGLMLESFWRIRYSNLGFQSERLVAATLHLTAPRYRDPAARAAFLGQLLERARRLPGVQEAGLTTAGEIPPGGGHATNAFRVEGRVQSMVHRPIARFQQVSSRYFALLAIPLQEGRVPRDSGGEVVVNRTLARRYFRGEAVLGRRITFGNAGSGWYTIVGIAGDVKTSGLASAPEATVYHSYRDATGLPEYGLVLRSSPGAATLAEEVRRMVAGLDPAQPVASVETLDHRLSASVARPRFTAAMLAAFASLALLLGVIGIYGVMACRVRWQWRELAVRQALGARPADLLRHVLRHGVKVILPGVALGLAGAAAVTRLLGGMLYEVRPNDPRTLAAAALLLAGVALAACWIPAARAARIDAMAALRRD